MRVFEIGHRTLAILLLIAVSLLAGSPAFAAGTIEVTGEGEVKVVADEVILTLSVQTLDQELSKSLNESNSRVKRIFDVLTSHRVEPKKIQTDYMRCYPKYERDEHLSTRPIKFVGYAVSKQIVVTLNDLSKFEGVLSGVVASGATHVHGIQFRTTQLRKHRDAARDMAMNHAKEKAIAMAAAVGQKVGRATSIKEAVPQRWEPRYQMQAAPQQVSEMADQREPFMGESIALGEIGVKANVLVTFELE